MKRKLIWQGHTSATLTLPIDWIRKHGLREGAEIDIVPSGEHLMVGAAQAKIRRKVRIDLHQPVGSAVRKLIASLYRAGYDDIHLTFDDPALEHHIQQMVWKEIVGFEAVKENDHSYILKDIAELDPEGFTLLFKNSFLLLLTFTQETIHYLHQKDHKLLQELWHHDLEINKITNLCQRLLHKKMNDRRKIVTFAAMLRAIEKLGDCYKDLISSCLQRKRFPEGKSLQMLEALTEKLQQIYHQYYRFNVDDLLMFNNELREINKTLMNDPSTDKDIYKFLPGIIQQMETLSGGPLVLNIEGEDVIREEDWIR